MVRADLHGASAVLLAFVNHLHSVLTALLMLLCKHRPAWSLGVAIPCSGQHPKAVCTNWVRWCFLVPPDAHPQ